MIAIIASGLDAAGLNIRDKLLGQLKWEPESRFDGRIVYKADGKDGLLYTLSTELVSREHLDREIKADFFIFISRHASKYPVPALTAHAIGNWGAAEHGGSSHKLVPTSAVLLKRAVKLLSSEAVAIGFDSFQEATHHGPLLGTPAIFVEIGSTEKEWTDSQAGEAAARCVVKLLDDAKFSGRVAVGIGGLHNMPSFKRWIVDSDVAISHTCPKYCLKDLDEQMMKQAISKTVEEVDLCLLDWKGMGFEKHRIVELLQRMGIAFEKN